jgi:hypothetical protein
MLEALRFESSMVYHQFSGRLGAALNPKYALENLLRIEMAAN